MEEESLNFADIRFRHAFILSAPRSGSTLLRVNLNKAPGLIAPPETYFLEFFSKNRTLNPSEPKDRKVLVKRLLQFRNHLNQRNLFDKVAFQDYVDQHCSSWQEIFNFWIFSYAAAAGKKLSREMLICEKTPLHMEYQNELSELFPKAKLIYLIRDPRDVVASLKTCFWSTASVVSNAFLWSKYESLIYDNRENSVLIRYENMVDDPDTCFNSLSAFLEMEALSGAPKKAVAINKEKESTDFKNVASYLPIDGKHVGKWEHILSKPDRDLSKIESICHPQMSKYGYECTTKPKKIVVRLARLELKLQRWMKAFSRRLT